MFYQKELDFLKKIFIKCGISLKVLPTREFVESVDIAPNIFYRLTDVLGLHYIFFLLPDTAESTLLLIGPYESSDMTAETSSLMTSLDVFCETIWGSKSSYKEVVIDGELKSAFGTFPFGGNESDEYIFSYNMRQMESRYSYENELMEAVTLGQSHKADIFFPDSKKELFEKRISDNLRNTKNYLIIMNTLCRKAAEKGGVHPFYLNNLSSEYAGKIESLYSTKDTQKLMRTIFKGYCKLVKNHNTKNYSKIVQNAILYIESNLDSDLGLSQLAKLNNVNSSYLSTLFKGETGMTITEFITRKRVDLAKHLLENQNIQIQSVAQKCGIFDLQYFSKVFKKHTGMTPRQFREKNKN